MLCRGRVPSEESWREPGAGAIPERHAESEQGTPRPVAAQSCPAAPQLLCHPGERAAGLARARQKSTSRWSVGF